MWPLPLHVCIKINRRNPSLSTHDKESYTSTWKRKNVIVKHRSARSSRAVWASGVGVCHLFTKHLEGGQDSAPHWGIRFLFVLCCDHAGPTDNSPPFIFNAAVMSALWSALHRSQRKGKRPVIHSVRSRPLQHDIPEIFLHISSIRQTITDSTQWKDRKKYNDGWRRGQSYSLAASSHPLLWV